MLRISKAFATGVIVLAVAACGTVEVTSTQEAGGTTGTGGTAGSGGGGVLPAPACAPGEAAIVFAASAGADDVIAFDNEGTWTAHPSVVSSAVQITTYEDVNHHLGAFWIDGKTYKSHFATTADGESFDVHDVLGWAPYGDPLAAVTMNMLLGIDAGVTSLAVFDPDAFDWDPYLAPTPLAATSAAPLAATGEILVVGVGPNRELCDVATNAGAWGSIHCRDDVLVTTLLKGEIPVSPPRAVALPNGDVVVLYYSDAGPLTATTLHAGAWSAPQAFTSGPGGIVFVATATPKGDVVVGTHSSAGVFSALRYAPDAGWGALIPIDQAGSPLFSSAAPGICGDDALIAYAHDSTEGIVRVARVRGGAVEVRTVGGLPGNAVMHVSIATRPASAP